MRFLIAISALLVSPIAQACAPGDDVTFTRTEDGALFNPDRVGETSDGLVYRGLFDGKTAYLTTSSSAAGSSGFRPPAGTIRWQRTLGPLEEGQLVGEVPDGPLQGIWQVACQATN